MKIRIYTDHWVKPLKNCSHGPAAEYWPWWKLVGFLFCRPSVTPPTSGWRFWFYFHGRGGSLIDVIFDRRKLT